MEKDAQPSTNGSFGLLASDKLLIRAIVAQLLLAFCLVLALNSGQILVERHQVRTAARFSKILQASSEISTCSQRLALLLFASLSPPRKDLQDRLIKEAEEQLSTIDAAILQFDLSESLQAEKLIGRESEIQLGLLKGLAQQFVAIARSIESPGVRSSEEEKDLIAAFAEHATRLLKESRTTISIISQESVKAAEHDRRLQRNILFASSAATIATAVIVLLFIVYRLRQELRIRRITESNLQRLNKELESFSAIVAHDLRGPLNNIALSVELLRRVEASRQSTARDVLDLIPHEIDRLREMIQALLRLSRVSASQLEVKPLNLRELMKEIENSLGKVMEESKASIRYDGVSYINGDKTLLGNLFQNLIENSIKYTETGKAPSISIHSSVERETVHFVYDDNGSGIPPEFRDRVFEPFVKTNPASDGVGLGLSLVRKIAVAHGGNIFVREKPCPGTRFEIVLSRTLRS